jgi:hypothetical protein
MLQGGSVRYSKVAVLQPHWPPPTRVVDEHLRPFESVKEEHSFIQRYLKLADTALACSAASAGPETFALIRLKLLL